MRNVANVLPAAGWLTVMGASAVMSSANAEEAPVVKIASGPVAGVTRNEWTNIWEFPNNLKGGWRPRSLRQHQPG